MANNDIDFVLPWVDGNDPVWLAEKNKYAASEGTISSSNNSQYRDWGILRYWFRSVELYTPWVRKIHFVSWGHHPEWMNLNHPKLHFVRHSDFIPSQYLPTFSSHSIELNLHRIPDLSDHFVYFNDDIFVVSPMSPDDFFMDGLPRDCAIRNIPMLYDIGHINLNDINLINKAFHFDKQFKQNRLKWFNYRYGLHSLRSLFFLPLVEFSGVKNLHIANAYLKTTFQDVWERFDAVLDQTCQRKFRSVLDVNQWLFKYWQIVSGTFYPQWLTIGKTTNITDLKLLKKCLKHNSPKMICLQDSDWMNDIDPIKEEVKQVFQGVFPQKSSFEL